MKSGALDVFFAIIAWSRPFRYVLCPVNVARFHFPAVFWNRATSHTPRSRAKVSGKPVRGYEIGGKTAFRQEKCCTIRNLPRKSESCDKIRRFLPWSRCSQLPELIGRFVPATFAVKRSGESIDSGYSCESELVLHCFAERSQIQIRVFICQVSENPM